MGSIPIDGEYIEKVIRMTNRIMLGIVAALLFVNIIQFCGNRVTKAKVELQESTIECVQKCVSK